MKKLLFIFLLFCGFISQAQIVTNRSPINIVPQDANLNVTYAFKIPVFADTATATLYIAHDSLGKMFYNKHDSLPYFRTVNASGTKKWMPFGSGSGGGGGVTTVFGRAGAVVAIAGDYASFYASLTGSYSDPTWIVSLSASKISGGQTVTPGSSKITLTGTPAGAALQPFAIDVVPSNINLTALGGLLGIAQINATGAASSSTFLRGDGTWSSPGTTVTGLPNSNVGSGYRLTFPATNNVRTLFTRGYLSWDSTTNANGLTIYADTSAGKLATKTDIAGFSLYNLDSVLSHGGQFSANRLTDMNTFNWDIKNVNSITFENHSSSVNNGLGGAFMAGNENYDNGGFSNAIFGTSDSAKGGSENLIGGAFNSVTGSFNLVAGESNKVGSVSSNIVGGENNVSLGSDNFIGGNTDSADNASNFVVGNSNRAKQSYSVIAGQFNKTNRAYQNAFGQFNDTTGHYYMLMIGNGTSNAARRNSFATDTAGWVYNKGLVNPGGFQFLNPTDGISDTIATRAFVRSIGGGSGGGSSQPFLDNTSLIKNNADNSKQAIFSAASITTATTRTYILPDVNGTLDLAANTATLTNKTINASSNTITNLTNANLNAAGISNANMHTMAAHTTLMNNTGGSSVPIDATQTQLTAEVNMATSTTKGSAPASGGGTSNFFRADIGWFRAYQPSDTLTELATRHRLDSLTAIVDSIPMRTPGTGITPAFVSPAGTLTFPKFVAGTGITITQSGTDSSITWNSTGGGGGSSLDTVISVPATANYTIPSTTRNIFLILADLSGQANRTLTYPTNTAGQIIKVKNNNTISSGFNWSFANGPIKDFTNSTITTVNTLTVYTTEGDGTNWDIIN